MALPANCRAHDAAPVVLVSQRQCCAAAYWPEAEAALLAELRAAGFSVRTITPVTAPQRDAVSREPEGAPVAVVWIERFPHRDPSTAITLLVRTHAQRAQYRRMQITEHLRPDAATMAALLAVETMTAALQTRVPVIPRPSRTAPDAGPHAVRQSIGLTLAADGFLGLPLPRPGGGIDYGIHPERGPQWRIGVRAFPGGQRIRGAGATSALSHVQFAFWLLTTPFRRGVWMGTAGVGGGATALFVRGVAPEDLPLLRDNTVVGHLGATVGSRWRTAPGVYWTAAAGAGLLLADVAIAHGDRLVHTVGRFYWTGELGILFDL